MRLPFVKKGLTISFNDIDIQHIVRFRHFIVKGWSLTVTLAHW